MGSYAYKYVRDALPDYIIKEQGADYEGTVDYDGDQWYAAQSYIIDLEREIIAQHAITKKITNSKLEEHLRKSSDGYYHDRPILEG